MHIALVCSEQIQYNTGQLHKSEGGVGASAHHHGENNGSRRRLDHPEQHQARELGDSEQVNLSQWDVTQVDEVWLVLCRHAEQLEAVEELRNCGTEKVKDRWIEGVKV